ncbi:MAG: ATP synthase F1 subunit gamma [Dehalococcoidia bacterium]|nr:ATP synthase F1 subunit gamma [Dehalococcoidia bacterium]
MPSTREIRRRIRSVKSTAKITKAMEMVAASKMRKAQQRDIAARPYARKMQEVLTDLAAQPRSAEVLHPLLQQRPVQRITVVHITADRGLCGGLNANMNRRTAAFLLDQKVPVSLVTVGKRGRDFMIRYGRDVKADFTQLGDYPELIDTVSIARVIMDDYMAGNVDQVYLAYTDFVNTAIQKPKIMLLLPVEPAESKGSQPREYIYEPSPAAVLSELLPRFVEMQVYHAVLESIASEFSARMVAMRNASDAAFDMINSLTLTYNKVRQETITRELSEISAGAAALS